MKRLTTYLKDNEKLIVNQRFDEKLIINKNYKYSDIFDEIKNIKWTEEPYAGKQTTDNTVVDKFIKYIKENNIKNLTHWHIIRRVNNNAYLCGINEKDEDEKTIVLYHISDNTYNLFERIVINQSPYTKNVMFTCNSRIQRTSVAPLNIKSAFYKEGTPEHYEISKETFDKFVNLYNEL